MSNNSDKPPKQVGNWLLSDKLGSGYSGSIFRATNVHDHEQVVALKVQDVDHECPTNRYEKAFFPALQGGKGMPILWATGVHGKWDYLAMELLGKSLDSIFRSSGKTCFDLRSVCSVAMQLIDRMQFMHSRGILHRDIQLGNCTVGLPPNEKTIYMIDFGFSKFYIDRHTKAHIPDSRAPRDFIGNYWFSSVNVHCRGRVPSRRDDMEAVALMLIHMLTPNGLPWTRNGVPKTDEAHDRLKQQKKLARPDELCHGLPSEFEEFLRYCRRLKFMDQPDYEHWVEEFRNLAVKSGFGPSEEFVWPPPQSAEQLPVRRPPSGIPRPRVASREMEALVRDLAKVDIQNRQVLGDLKNLQKPPAEDKASKTSKTSVQTIEISSDEEEGDELARLGRTKATQLRRLTVRAGKVADNAALGKLVQTFIKVLKSNTGRAMTKEGFAFIDTVHKQLADPSVYTARQQRSLGKTRSQTIELQQSGGKDKLVGLARLRNEVSRASTSFNNSKLAEMVSEFGEVIDRSGNRLVTKDAFGFLEGLGQKLQVGSEAD